MAASLKQQLVASLDKLTGLEQSALLERRYQRILSYGAIDR
jgi:acetyl-CoA carboxylase alpha subunit